MPIYKLTYFPFRGLGEMNRMIFAYANQPFEDNRVQMEDWPKIKPTTPFGQMPVLEIDGKQLSQSNAVARYLARQFNLAGSNDFEAAQVDAVADLQKDLYGKITPFFLVAMGHVEGDKEALKQTVLIPALEQYMPIYERLLKESGSGFFAKSGVTWADFFIEEALLTMTNVVPDEIGKYKWVQDYIKRVQNVPQIKDYIAKRPVTPF